MCLFSPFVVLFSTEIVSQKRWRCLATGHAGVDILPDYLRSDKKDVNQAKNPLFLTAVQFGVHKSTDGPIANYCNCWCHLSKLKSSRTHPKPIGISVYMSIIADYTTSSIPHGILFQSENCIPISRVYMDTSDPIRFLIGIDLFLSCNPNVLYIWHLQKW